MIPALAFIVPILVASAERFFRSKAAVTVDDQGIEVERPSRQRGHEKKEWVMATLALGWELADEKGLIPDSVDESREKYLEVADDFVERAVSKLE